MRVTLRIMRLLLCALALGITLPAALLSAKTPKHPVIGIGDGKPDLFKDPRFLALRIKNVRYDMPWDALTDHSQVGRATAWLKAAKADGMSVLVTIDHSRKVIYKKVKVKVTVHGKTTTKTETKGFSQSRVMPTTAQYINAFKAFREKFPFVTQFVTWDETNCYCEVTYNKEAQIAAFYRGLRKSCPRCTILAAEFLDVNKHSAMPMTTWAKTLIKDLGYQPGYWGLNDYEDANHLVTNSTRQLLAAIHGNVWLAETGGIVNRPHTTDKQAGFTQNAAHAAKVDSFVLKTLGSLSPRIQRIYLYEWDAKTRRDSWDTALISYNKQPRAGYKVLATTLSSWGVRPDCTISLVPPSCVGFHAGPTGPTGSTGATH